MHTLGRISLAAALLLACGQPPPISLEGEDSPEHVAFPPPEPAWSERTAFAGGSNTAQTGAGLHVVSPILDPKRHFELDGQVVRIAFDDFARPADSGDAGAPMVPTFTPAMPGATRWTDDGSLEFRADRAFDPATEYAIDLPELATARGKRLEGGWHATFVARPSREIAGKTIHYTPKLGVPRVVYVRPFDELIAPTREFLIIYDQAIELPLAKTLISAQYERGGAVPLTLRHPPGTSYEGIPVDPRVLVLAKMTPAPPPGAKLTLTVKGKREADEPVARSFEIAQPPRYEKMDCEGCKVTGTDAAGSPYNWGVFFTFSNSLGWHDDYAKHVQIAPIPRNFSASTTQNELGVHGEWEPNVTYTIHATGISDRFGYPVPDVHATFHALPRSANTILRDGVVMLDAARARDFFVTTRNVARGELRVWPIDGTPEALKAAIEQSRSGKAPDRPPQVIPFENTDASSTYVETKLDLAQHLTIGQSYLATAVTTRATADAPMPGHDGWTSSSLPVLMLVDDKAVGAHVHRAGDRAFAQIYRLGSGEPAVGFGLELAGAKATTDATGTALLQGLQLDGPRGELPPLSVEHDGAHQLVPFPSKTQITSAELYPELANAVQRYEDSFSDERSTSAAIDPERVGFLLTDKGIYRPGGLIHVKAFLRHATGEAITPLEHEPVRLRVVGPNGNDLADETLVTGDVGTVTKDVEVPAGTMTGRYHVRLESVAGDADLRPLYYDQLIRIAEFETPKFKVDVTALESSPERLRATVRAKYFFGAPLSGGHVSWTLRKKPVALPSGPLANAGLTFVANPQEWEMWDDQPAPTEAHAIFGEGTLDATGGLEVNAALGKLEAGPTQIALEAQVFDPSYRMIAGRLETVQHPYWRYAGLKLDSSWGASGKTTVQLGVVGKDGGTLVDVPVEARLSKMTWKRVAQQAESGATIESWKAIPTLVTSCRVQSAATMKACDLQVPGEGSYRIDARVDGHDDGSISYYAWGSAGAPSDVPSSGKKMPISTDKKKYLAGETAKILAQSPFAETTAVLAVERGGLIQHETKRVKGATVQFELPLTATQQPYVHATITLLPIGPATLGYRVGAVRIPVGAKGGGPEVSVRSQKKSYDAGDEVDVTVEVKRGGAPLPGADVTLAVVDEAILRMTDFHTVDPTSALHPAHPLDFTIADSRELVFRRKQKAHVGGDGEGGDEQALETRKDFVETLLWAPTLTTDGQGRATAHVKLADNLSEFRMMATALDETGASGIAESSFVVARPFLIEPIVPQFALQGDRFEIAAMAHNNTDAEVKAQVHILRESRDVVLPPHGRVRVAVPFVAEHTQNVEFELWVGDQPKDRVERELDVSAPGSEEHPRVSGIFHEHQLIDLAIPAEAMFDEGATLTVRTGSALYPELGERLSFLLQYPHGCVEQTTSGLLPLLAAKVIMPWTGLEPLSKGQLENRIVAGVKRLASMKAEDGGLAYWPGGTQAHLFGTAYAARALLRASAMGIEEGTLLPDVLDYLKRMLPAQTDPNLRASIAEVLAQGGKLEAESADSLYESRAAVDPFGLASLSLALASLPGQSDRVAGLLDQLEGKFDERGDSVGRHGEYDYTYWGSGDRDRAQTLLALTRLRKGSKLVPRLVARTTRHVDRYATQNVAWSLMAFAEHIGKETPNGKVDVKLAIAEGGVDLGEERSLGGNNKEVRIALAALRGKRLTLRLTGDAQQPSAFTLDARYRLPFSMSPRTARHAENGASVHRVYTDPKGHPLNLAQVKAGDVVRVAIRAELAQQDGWRRRYFALTDFFPAGFDPIQPDLATVGQNADVERVHPFYEALHGRAEVPASHVDLRADRVNLYFDDVTYDRLVYATYLLRATTPGEFFLPAAGSELMYEPNSEGFTESGHVTIVP